MTGGIFVELRELVTRLLKIAEEEYAVISTMLRYMDQLPDVEEIQQVRRDYAKRLEQLEQIREVSNQFLMMVDEMASAYSCAESEPLSTHSLPNIEILNYHRIDEIWDSPEACSFEENDEAQDSHGKVFDCWDVLSDSHEVTGGKKAEIGAAKVKYAALTELLSETYTDGALSSDSTADSSTTEPSSEAHTNGVSASDPTAGSPTAESSSEAHTNGVSASDFPAGSPTAESSSDAPANDVPASAPTRRRHSFGPLFGRGFTSSPEILFQPPNKYCPNCGAEVDPSGRFCPICGARLQSPTQRSPESGTKAVAEHPTVTLDRVQFSAVAPRTFVKGDYSIIEVLMYEEAFRSIVDEVVANADEPVKETKSGKLTAERNAKITVILSSPDVSIEDNTEVQTWRGEYLRFSFAVELPEQYRKKQILFVASVYINGIIATRLKFVAKCKSFFEQKIKVTRDDVLSAFMSYASQDRSRVAMIIQGMRKARPDMDIFFDVDRLRSGEHWEDALRQEIDRRDVLFLCWSKYARKSKWVDAEWRYALKQKGEDSIEPVPIDPPEICPPPDELSSKHFNDRLLYIINGT